MVPNCPVHGTPMRPSNKGGGFFCSKKVGDDYCTQKVSAAQAAQMGGVVATAPVAFPSANGHGGGSEAARYQLAAAAIIAASWTLGQTAEPTATIATARMYYGQMEGMVKS